MDINLRSQDFCDHPMPSSSTPLKHVFWSGDLPESLFDGNRYPSHPVRINSYSRPRYLLDILNILNGMSELDVLLASPLGALFSLPVRQCAMSGQLVHQMLCRQLHTDNSDETWFLFAGQPIRFSLIEFEQITGLCCAPFPAASDLEAVTTHSEGSAPYWYTLIGRKLGGSTVEDLLSLLKSDVNMPAWRKFRLALIVIVEGILLCRTQPVKPSFEVVEMVKNVEFFLHYPWGRASFKRILRMVKISDYIEDKVSLIKKLKQSSMAVHGFPLAIQLLAFRTIPLFLKYLPNAEDQSTFRDQTVACLRKCRAFHTSNILAVENDADVQILFPHPSHLPFRSTNQRDPKILNLESLISAGHNFQAKLCARVDSRISGTSSSKRKHIDVDCGDSDGQSPTYLSNQSNTSKMLKSVTNVDDILELKLQSFKESLMADLGYLFLNRKGRRTKKSTEYTSSKNLYRCLQSPSRLTRSLSAGVVSLSGSQSSAITDSQSSSMQKAISSQIPLQLSSDRRFILVFPDPVTVPHGDDVTDFQEQECSEKSITKDEGGDLVNAYCVQRTCRAIVPFHTNPDRYNTM